MDRPESPRVLLSGASGYAGGRLLQALQNRSERLRCLVRRPDYFRGADCDVITGNVLDPASLGRAFEGIDVAYYLVRTLGSNSGSRADLIAGARNFARAARLAGVSRIIYLGSLPRRGGILNLVDTRLEIGDILSHSGVPTLEFRATAILGSGSFLYEVVRALVDRTPVMLVPRWAYHQFQPIAVEDVVSYLVLGLDYNLEGRSRVVEIGGRDRTSFAGLMKEYARQQGLTRLQFPMPMSSTRLSSHWLALFTPVPAHTNHRLIEDLRHASPIEGQAARESFPIVPRNYREAIARARVHEDNSHAETRWSDAVSSGSPDVGLNEDCGPRLVYCDETWVPYPPALAFQPIQRVGGEKGWYCSNWLWRLRGFLDLLAGGVGMRRGRRHPMEVSPGDAIDFWRVHTFEPDRLLRLEAEMLVPGNAWLEFKVESEGHGSLVRLSAFFDPKGVIGTLYWYALYPVHVFIFRGMLREMSDEMGRLAAEAGPSDAETGPPHKERAMVRGTTYNEA